MALFVPGVREKNQNFIEGPIGKRNGQRFDGVMADHAQIGELRLLGAQQQPADSRTVDLDPEVIDVRIATPPMSR